MKILCPTDFSQNSMNAIYWALEYLENFDNSELEILHCLQAYRRADMFVSIDDLMMERAQKDMDLLQKELDGSNWRTDISFKLFQVDPKTYIAEYAAKINADIIVAGSKGLTNLKDMTIGSVTEQVARRSHVPLLIIPATCSYQKIDKVVVGIDEKLVEQPQVLEPLNMFLAPVDAKLYLAQVVDKKLAALDIENIANDYLKDTYFEHVRIPLEGNVAKSLNVYSKEIKADVLAMAHRHRTWLGRIFHHSIMKEELFSLEIPFFIIPVK